MCPDLTTTAGGLLEDGLERDLIAVGTLDLGVDAGEGTAEGVFGGGVDHLGL